jgi:hypothetical protein
VGASCWQQYHLYRPLNFVWEGRRSDSNDKLTTLPFFVWNLEYSKSVVTYPHRRSEEQSVSCKNHKPKEALENRSPRCHHHVGQHVSYLHPEKEPERIKSSMAPPPPPPARPATSAIQHVLERETVLFTCVRGEKRFLLYICLLVSERAAYAYAFECSCSWTGLALFLGVQFSMPQQAERPCHACSPSCTISCRLVLYPLQDLPNQVL